MADNMHTAFKNLLTGGSEHRKMMLPEADATLLRLVCKCIDFLKFAAKHANCQWSTDIILHAENLKENTLVEYSSLQNRWKKQMGIEKETKFSLPQITQDGEKETKICFPRITLAQKSGYKAAIKEEYTLMQSILTYIKIQTNSQVKEEQCRTIVTQAATLSAVLSGLVGEDLLSSIHKSLATSCTKNLMINLATADQKSSILNTIRCTRNLAFNVVMALSNFDLYVISYSPDSYASFIFMESPVHKPIESTRKAKIAYIETLSCHRKTYMAKKLIQWVEKTAKENGYQSLYATTVKPNKIFWEKCGFKLELDSNIVLNLVLNLDPMSIENIVNKASV
jgi:hypothetical protein